MTSIFVEVKKKLLAISLLGVFACAYLGTSAPGSDEDFLPAGPGQEPFNVTQRSITLSEINIGPAKDEIPALFEPKFLPAAEGDKLLDPSDRVWGVEINGEARTYPLRILNWHELVNDVVGGRPLLVSW